MYSPINCIVID